MKNEVDEFLGNLDGQNDDFKEDTDPFKQEIVPEGKVEEVAETPEEKPLPFNKDPKVQRFIDKQVAKALEARGPVEKEFVKDTADVDDYYERLIGNDTPEKVAMIREAKAREELKFQQSEERAFKRLSEREQQSIAADAKAAEELDTAIEDIEERFGVDLTSNTPTARKLNVDFMKFVERVAPKNSTGEITNYPDMQSTFETFQEMKPTPAPSRAKDLASRSMGRSSETSTQPQERVTFDNMDSIMDRLLGK